MSVTSARSTTSRRISRIVFALTGTGPPRCHDVPVLELIDFLLARIADDERAAIRASSQRSLSGSERQLEHFERWLPTRVLAECEAKRTLIAKWSRYGRELR